MTKHTDLELIEIGRVAVQFIEAQRIWNEYMFKHEYQPTSLRDTVDAKKPFTNANHQLYHLVFKDEK